MTIILALVNADNGFLLNDEFENGLHHTVGVWIMPNNNLNGMLEDFISFLVPKDDKLLPIVHSTLDDIEKQKLNKYSAIVIVGATFMASFLQLNRNRNNTPTYLLHI